MSNAMLCISRACGRAALLAALCLSPLSLAQAFDHPGGLHPHSQIAFTRQQVMAGAEPWQSAWAQLLRQADSGLNETPSAISYYSVPGYYGDPDGHGDAKARLASDANAAYATALAYAIGANLSPAQRNRYADKAIQILNDWAYTNEDFPTNDDSRLVIAYTAPALAFAAELVWNYPAWSDADKNQFRRWAKNVLTRAGNLIKNRTNNWADWGVLALVASAHVRDDDADMQAAIEALKHNIDERIASDGTLPREIGRGDRSLHYTNFSLEPMTAAVEIVRNSGGPNLYDWTPPSGGTIKKALDFLFDHGIADPDSWPGGDQLLEASPNGKASDTFQAMGLVYQEQAWLDWVNQPVYMAGTGMAFIAPTLMQPLPKDGAVGAAPAAPQNVQVRLITAQ